MMKERRSRHATHVWVRTDLVEEMMENDGGMSSGWKARSMKNDGNGNRTTSRKRSRNSLNWGWARACVAPVSPTHASSMKANKNNCNDGPSNPFGSVRLRKVRCDSSSSRLADPTTTTMMMKKKSEPVTITVTVDDDEFAPAHLQDVTVTFTYDPGEEEGGDNAKVCTANSWWLHLEEDEDEEENLNNTNNKPPDDLTSLSHLHEPAVIFALKRRYEYDQIYTYTGKILLALNPFRNVDNVYGQAVMQQYWDYKDKYLSANDNPDDEPANSNKNTTINRPSPHIYAVAEDAYHAMMRSLQTYIEMHHHYSHPHQHQHQHHPQHQQVTIQDQSILVSGESGAGKTVTTKIIMGYLATLSTRQQQQQKNDKVNIEAQVLQSNPILESFGNARTIRNDNSSRFGKFIEIQFNHTGRLLSASIETYLLEKVRLVSQAPGERNYHIFYELLKGLSHRERHQLLIADLTTEDFKITAASGTTDRRDGVDDRDTFKELRMAFDTVGFTVDEQQDLLLLPCALLHTSNLSFTVTNDYVELDLSNQSLKYAIALLGVSVDDLNYALCHSSIEARGEILFKNLTLSQAHKALEALIKATYGALFIHIVHRINQSIQSKSDHTNINHEGIHQDVTNATAHIGVLDIFGFESFQTNSFEQLCINYCNEALQQQFNRFVFKLEQEEYKQEGIQWSFVSFPDNQDVLSLIEKKHDGILSILDEQCRLQRCTYNSFAMALYQKCGGGANSDHCHPRFRANTAQRSGCKFSIHHYAGYVEYDTKTHFLEKNKDELPKETTELLMSSKHEFIHNLGIILKERSNFVHPSSSPTSVSPTQQRTMLQRSKSTLMREGVGSQFRIQLSHLRNRINNTEPHYVRCLKPNDDLVPYNFQPSIISDQLRCAGVLEAIRVSRVGFPHRYTHAQFVLRYRVLAASEIQHAVRSNRNVSKDNIAKHLCQLLCNNIASNIQQNFDVDNHVHSKDNDTAVNNFKTNSPADSKTFLGMQMGRTKVFLRLQTFETLEFLRSRKVEESAIIIQCYARRLLASINFEISLVAIEIIQNFFRKQSAIRYVWKKHREHVATSIQCAWRGYVARMKLLSACYIAIWLQSQHRGAVARELYLYLLMDRKATIIQRSWKKSRIRIPSIAEIRSAIISLQTHCRSYCARKQLKQLRIEANDLKQVAAERDKFREETKKLRRELEMAQKIAEEEKKKNANNAKRDAEKDAKDEVERLQKQVDRLKQELARANQMSPTHSHQEELQSLADECQRKEKQLGELRDQLAAFRYQQRCISWQDQSRDEESTLSNSGVLRPCPQTPVNNSFHLRSPAFKSNGSVSLLDTDDFDETAMESIPYNDQQRQHPLYIGVKQTLTPTTITATTVASTADSQQPPPPPAASNNTSSKVSVFTYEDDKWQFFREMRRLHTSIRNDDRETFNAMLFPTNADSGNNNELQLLVIESDEMGRTALHMAARTSQLYMAEKLLEIGAVANAQDNDGETPLHLSKNVGMTRLLLVEGNANPNIPNIDGICSIHLAVQRRDIDSVRVLLRHQANVNYADHIRWFTPLHLTALPARTDHRNPNGTHRHHNNDYDSNYYHDDNSDIRPRIAQLLCGAASIRNIAHDDHDNTNSSMNFIDDDEPDLNYQDSEGNTPLHYAVQLKTPDALELMKIFLDYGSNPKIMNNRDQTPLHLLCHNESLREHVPNHDNTYVHSECDDPTRTSVFDQMFRLILKYGADPNQQSMTGCTALHLTLYHQDINSSVRLIQSGADLHLLWKKPKRWASFWDDMGTSQVLPLDMVEDKHSLFCLLAAVVKPQKRAPTRSWCMHCKMVLGTFSRPLHCKRCGRFICGTCSRRATSKLLSRQPHIFPPTDHHHTDNSAAWLCLTCEQIMVSSSSSSSSSRGHRHNNNNNNNHHRSSHHHAMASSNNNNNYNKENHNRKAFGTVITMGPKEDTSSVTFPATTFALNEEHRAEF